MFALLWNAMKNIQLKLIFYEMTELLKTDMHSLIWIKWTIL